LAVLAELVSAVLVFAVYVPSRSAELVLAELLFVVSAVPRPPGPPTGTSRTWCQPSWWYRELLSAELVFSDRGTTAPAVSGPGGPPIGYLVELVSAVLVVVVLAELVFAVS
jgi:hypothetical protein